MTVGVSIDRGIGQDLRGAFLTGTASAGSWVAWWTGGDYSIETNDRRKDYVALTPVDATHWQTGAYLFAGVLYNHGNHPAAPGPVVMVRKGYCPYGYVKDSGGNVIAPGFPLVYSNESGVARDAASPGSAGENYLGAALGTPATTTVTTVPVIVRI